MCTKKPTKNTKTHTLFDENDTKIGTTHTLFDMDDTKIVCNQLHIDIVKLAKNAYFINPRQKPICNVLHIDIFLQKHTPTIPSLQVYWEKIIKNLYLIFIFVSHYI